SIILNSILCSKSIIGSKCDIKESVVCFGRELGNGGNYTKLNGETVTADGDDGEFTLDDD
ncbi:unnamed protein product, partial [Didymodactylos carnosus]